jgi:hypothetical protein
LERANYWANIEKVLTGKKTHKVANTDRAYCDNNRYKDVAGKAKRRAKKLNAVPFWLNVAHFLEIECMYMYHQIFSDIMTERPGWHVDHIEPLQGNNVCGLHVPWNLQVLPAMENLSKGNR